MPFCRVAAVVKSVLGRSFSAGLAVVAGGFGMIFQRLGRKIESMTKRHFVSLSPRFSESLSTSNYMLGIDVSQEFNA